MDKPNEPHKRDRKRAIRWQLNYHDGRSFPKLLPGLSILSLAGIHGPGVETLQHSQEVDKSGKEDVEVPDCVAVELDEA